MKKLLIHFPLRDKSIVVGLKVLTAVVMKSTTFWVYRRVIRWKPIDVSKEEMGHESSREQALSLRS
jgi:hypothetical protein